MLNSLRILLAFLGFAIAALVLTPLLNSQSAPDPWPGPALLEPPALARLLAPSAPKPPTVISVAFPVLYNSKHVAHAIFAGPGSKPEGIEALKKAAQSLAKDADIVLYCGCCPMEMCPNIRPAFRTLQEMGFTHVRVLHIPTNMSTDWYSKGYPSDEVHP